MLEQAPEHSRGRLGALALGERMNVHLVGSVPMANAEEVFTQVSAALGPYLKRVPDGETGERLNWVGHLEKVFASNPALERTDELFKIHPTAIGWYRHRLKKGKRVADVHFD